MNAPKVLVVSSDESALDRYSAILKGSGCEVTEARSIKEAFEHLDEPFEVVFTDFNLVDGDAAEFAAHIAVLAPALENIVCLTSNFSIEAKYFKKLIDRASDNRSLTNDLRTALALYSPAYVGWTYNRRH